MDDYQVRGIETAINAVAAELGTSDTEGLHQIAGALDALTAAINRQTIILVATCIVANGDKGAEYALDILRDILRQVKGSARERFVTNATVRLGGGAR